MRHARAAVLRARPSNWTKSAITAEAAGSRRPAPQSTSFRPPVLPAVLGYELGSATAAALPARRAGVRVPSARLRSSLLQPLIISGFGEERVTGVSSGSMGDSSKEEPKRTGLEGTGRPLQGGSHGNLLTAGSDQLLRQTLDSLKSSKSPAVISYGASWCRVCSQIIPSFSKFSNEFKNLTFIYADIDECPETTQSIRYTPTFHFYRDGERVDEMLGTGEERLHDRLWLHS